ncbi:MAG: GNAT family N-acetyltransferase, partial [Thermoleophilaceae bacterium]|nr:GNAT family N-acetyltransferase [Thermoleophilaceae bacterium]
SMIRAIGRPPPGTFETYATRHGGMDDAAVLGLFECAGNAEVVWVATRPEAAGNRLAGRLLGHALAEARGRGCETATLEATRQGEPAYAAIGFRPLGAVQMWECRP